jgi:hypothetical protein
VARSDSALACAGAHGGFRGGEILIVVDAVLDQPIERARAEHFPPSLGHIAPRIVAMPGPPGR